MVVVGIVLAVSLTWAHDDMATNYLAVVDFVVQERGFPLPPCKFEIMKLEAVQ